MKKDMNYHLAIDIGASSGRHILGYTENGIIKTEEIYRFENNLKREGENLVWDIDRLFESVKAGIAECKKIGKIPSTVAIDTWGVDYVLLDENKEAIKPVFCYRDSRTKKTVGMVESIIPYEKLYSLTGIQKQDFNSIYQLMSDKVTGRLEKAEYFLMIPEYLSFKLTGVIKNEYTNASTTGMINATTKKWDKEIIKNLGYPEKLFGELSVPCTLIGNFSKEIADEVGFDTEVIFCPSHDTASAVAACPLGDNDIYISSGTWSLMGVEKETAVLSEAAMMANFSNEGGIEYRFRILRNYMGMWLLQNIRRNIDKSMTYDEMMYLAMENEPEKLLDVNDERLVAPESMIDAVRDCAGDSNMTLGEVLSTVYHSLAASYKNATEEIETITGKSTEYIRIIGGGCRDKYLNELTMKYTGKKVSAGPVEATAIGNLSSQLIYSGECKDVKDVREMIKKSFDIIEK